MTRIKRGNVARKRRQKILKASRGYRGSGSKLFRMAKQRRMKALRFAYIARRLRKRQNRSLWIVRINNAVRHYDLNYNQFMFCLKQKNIHLNRKWLAELALREPNTFAAFVGFLQNK